ncbi:integrin-linked protein kinase [Folsomia candida]|uniref:Integrin-linked protein kinase n=2 Tax=Folsomia candida TaxID=158441 RepID=A0A226E5H3_FOLCA|nr:integrin-linked protein kinase [Folsomia candida]OXA52679.1 Integrin-linked protein kinase [Folsomia candida]
MENLFNPVWCREGNLLQVKLWLEDTENDLNQGDDHGFSALHWAAKYGQYKIVELLLQRGARVNAVNKGDDTPLHLAAAHGHHDVARLLLQQKAEVNSINEHGNTALHYACFWGYGDLADDLVAKFGALVFVTNRDGDTPLDKSKGGLSTKLHDRAVEAGQDLKKIPYKDQSWLGLKTHRSRDATLSRHKGINVKDLSLTQQLSESPSSQTWKGRWQGNEIVAKILVLRECTPRISRDFNEEFPKLRIFSHPNILPVIGCCNAPPDLVVISQFMPFGSLYNVLHQNTNVVVDSVQALKFALDIARGMSYFHNLERFVPNYYLNSYHVMIDEDLSARISMSDAKFGFQDKGKLYHPAWMSPEALQKRQSEINFKAADMWSFAIILWELATRNVPFADLSPMEAGMKIALESLRIQILPGISQHLTKLIRICMNEDPGKRPTFDMIVPILEKMQAHAS